MREIREIGEVFAISLVAIPPDPNCWLPDVPPDVRAIGDAIMRDGDHTAYEAFARLSRAMMEAAREQETLACDGSQDCDAWKHVHGCFADTGNCDEPEEHYVSRLKMTPEQTRRLARLGDDDAEDVGHE